ncbi:hypothetical protein [Cyanobium sp. LEGE 06113]|uniref:hypothetical protein n=1 Tax=Cyanobium sp. LEGE 06113 TaxID=1297573 RepID=UPI00187F7363|nr:hypothetical protein [Cyanobium sp. LEGE 06113]MBE9155166.1 hypothetical protein [Cyanobium sp. LEGE 06113]
MAGSAVIFSFILRPLIASMASLVMNSWLQVRRLLNSFREAVAGSHGIGHGRSDPDGKVKAKAAIHDGRGNQRRIQVMVA